MNATTPAMLLGQFSTDAARVGTAAATDALVQRLDIPPHAPQPWSAIAQQLIQSGQLGPAIVVLDRAVQRLPAQAELHYLRGNALRLSGRDVEAERDLREVQRVAPAHRDGAWSLAFLLREQGRLFAAADVVARCWETQPDDLDATLMALGFLRECSAFEAARTLARAARERWPQHARLAAIAGEIELALGDFALARADLLAAIEHDREQSAAWLRLSHCQRYRDAHAVDLARFEATANDASLSATTRTCAGFALGKALDDLGEIARAAAALRHANALASRSASWNAPHWRGLIDRRLLETLAPVSAGQENFRPLFVIGLPRTGTTLISTRLARHPQVRERGELNWIPMLYDELGAGGRLRDRDALAAVAALVAAQMRRDDSPARYYVDKNPLNFRYVDFILALFPNARFVHCRRARRDTALSIWMQHFAHQDLAFAYDFSSIARVVDDETRCMRHWRATLNPPLFELDYEDLVSDPERPLRRLADFLELEPGPLLDSGSPIPAQALTTASVWQARQPLHRGSIGRWRAYAPYLPELLAAFPEEFPEAEFSDEQPD